MELATIVALRPRLALLDEPAAGIDLRSLEEIARVILGLRSTGSAVLLISHRQEMARIADRASQIRGGPAHLLRRAGDGGGALPRAPLRLLRRGSLPAMSKPLDALYPSLEQVGVTDAALRDRDTAHLLVDAHRSLSMHEAPGVEVRVRRRLFAVAVDVTSLRGAWSRLGWR